MELSCWLSLFYRFGFSGYLVRMTKLESVTWLSDCKIELIGKYLFRSKKFHLQRVEWLVLRVKHLSIMCLYRYLFWFIPNSVFFITGTEILNNIFLLTNLAKPFRFTVSHFCCKNITKINNVAYIESFR